MRTDVDRTRARVERMTGRRVGYVAGTRRGSDVAWGRQVQPRPVRIGPKRIRCTCVWFGACLGRNFTDILVATQRSRSPQDRLHRLEAPNRLTSSFQDLFLNPPNCRYAHPCFPERRVAWSSKNTPVTLRSTSSLPPPSPPQQRQMLPRLVSL